MSIETTALQQAVDATSLRASLGVNDTDLADIRAVGAQLGARVPELVERFYDWLSPQPEFAHFFGSQPDLLVRVKSHQVAYWRDFLLAEINDDYVERRRAIGLVHARIELGLLIYLRAMEFVSQWLIREIRSHESLGRERPSTTFSIRKLIQFDSAIVVHTYAMRTAQLLEQQRRRLHRVASVMRAVTAGDLEHRLDVTGADDLLGTSVNEMVKSLRSISREMSIIAGGDYSADIAPRSDRDQLGASLQDMTRALRNAAAKNEEHLWMTTTLAELGRAMSGNPSVDELSQGVLDSLCPVLGAQVGALYVLEEGSRTLRLTGTYAVAEGSGVPGSFKLGEGLIGQAAVNQRRLLVSHMPEDCIRIRWGMGEAVPRSLVVMPLIHEGEVRGVVELASLAQFSGRQLALLDRGAPSVGLAISAAQTRTRVNELLEESRAQAEELRQQQEELRSVNENLEEQTRALELQKESLLATETVLRQKTVELERASRYKSEFLANMSHELRTPLNSTLILAKLLMENRDQNLTPEQIKYAESIYSAGNDLLALINDILDLSKIEAGKIDLNIDAVSIARLMGDFEHRFRPLTADKGLALIVAVQPGCPDSIETDVQRLQQILTNLLSNAVKFTDTGTIRLTAAPSGSRYVSFTVEDTGIGIPAEQHDIIFQAFRQADGTTNRRFGGTGLGLSISRDLAALLGGEIRLSSTPGQGSAFTLLIPYRSGDVAATPPSAGPAPRAAAAPPEPVRAPDPPMPDAPPQRAGQVDDDRHAILDPRRVVLIVEDDPIFAELVRDLAHELSFQCIVASAADEGLRLAREYRPAAIVLDIGLPDGSGLTVLEVLKRDGATRHIPIHMISGHDHQQIAREMGAIGYMLKPVKREELATAFRALEERLARTMKSVLVVEDDAVQRDAITQLLVADNIHIAAVETAPEALEKLRTSTFDCVVLDLMLPGVSGFELLDQMAADERCSFPPVIIYTARMLSFDEEQALRRHSKSIIIKGARSPERLLEEVTLFLHQVEAELPSDKQRMLRNARDRESVFDGRRVLLVEDDVRNIFALTSMLEPRGLTVDIARNGKEALVRLSEEPSVDLVLMDIMMPEMDGLTATREIRKRGGNGALPIIALTAKAMPDDREQCFAAGANDYIAKPIDVDQLLSLLRVWMPR